MLTRAVARRPTCVLLSFADLRLRAAAVRAVGVPLICPVQTLREVDAALDAGPVATVTRGTEAGYHGGDRATLPFVTEVANLLARRAPQVLLPAAGGIADSQGFAAALLPGADGVVVGARFGAAEQALTAAPAVARAAAAAGNDAVHTRAIGALRDVPWPDAYSFRVLRNRVTDAWAGREAEALAARGLLRDACRSARASGDPDILPVATGEAVSLIARLEPAATLLTRMVGEAVALLTRTAPLDFTQRWALAWHSPTARTRQPTTAPEANEMAGGISRLSDRRCARAPTAPVTPPAFRLRAAARAGAVMVGCQLLKPARAADVPAPAIPPTPVAELGNCHGAALGTFAVGLVGGLSGRRIDADGALGAVTGAALGAPLGHAIGSAIVRQHPACAAPPTPAPPPAAPPASAPVRI
jgi:nitronate monooxygenase